MNETYNPNLTYDTNSNGIIYNGSFWFPNVSGKGSELGTPSDTNSNWKKRDPSGSDIADSIKKVQGSDLTPIYNELINVLMYNPQRMYRESDICFYNGYMWKVLSSPGLISHTSVRPTLSGSTLGVPSVTNSNWGIYEPPNMDPILIKLIKNTAHTTPPATPTNTTGPYGAPIDAQFMDSLRADIKSDITQAIRDSLSSPNVMTDSCIDSVSDSQGADFMRYIPGKNPADYIRKDSIPCYGCSVP